MNGNLEPINLGGPIGRIFRLGRAVKNREWHVVVPLIVTTLVGIYLITARVLPTDPEGKFKLHEFAKLPAVDGGRVKPIDTVARTNLMVISKRQEFRDGNENGQLAVKWLLDVMVSNRAFDKHMAEKHQVFRIENDQLLSMLGLPLKPEFLRYSIDEIQPKFPQLEQQIARVEEIDPKKRDTFDQHVLELSEHLKLYIDLSRFRSPLLIPPTETEDNQWKALPEAIQEAHQQGTENLPAKHYARMLEAYAQNNPKGFNKELAGYQEWLAKNRPDDVSNAEFEVFFNHFAPFYQCTVLYVFMLLLACAGWVAFPRVLQNTAFWLGMLILAVHTWGLIARMSMQGRPPITNLYSTAVFIGWFSVILGLVLEWIYRNGVGNATAALLGFLTSLVSHHLALSGDTLEMMQAVLDTNFWLATHVTIINIGYAASFVAGLLGAMYILLGVCTPVLDRDGMKSVSGMIYGIVCFAVLFSFTGTVLGGIWADQSWGRFWGWDPKENGALLIVIWNALILHARWAGMAKQRGIALLAVLGNMVTIWSWFGTNQLGVGLHAYGFNNALVKVCDGVWLSCLMVFTVGMIPQRYWWSHKAQLQQQAAKAPDRKRGRRDEPAAVAAR